MSKIENRKLFRLIRTMRPKELVQFSRYLKRIQKGQNTLERRLLHYLTTKDPGKWTDTSIWKAIQKDRPLNVSRLNRYASDLSGYIEDFWLTEGRYWEAGQKELELVQQYNRRHLFQLAENKMSRLQQTLSQPIRDADQQYKHYQLAIEAYQHAYLQALPNQGQKLAQVLQSFDDYWLLQRLIYACHAQTANQITNSQIAPPAMKAVLTIIDDMQETASPLLMVYRELYALLSGERTSTPQAFRKMLAPIQDQLPLGERSTIFEFLLNYFIRAKNQNQQHNSQEIKHIVELYEWGIRDRFLIGEGYLNFRHYKNIQTIYLQNGQADKAREYLEDWLPLLRPELQDTCYQFCLLQILFEEGQFDQVRKQLAQFPFQEVHMRIQSHILEVKVLYELRDQLEDWSSDVERKVRNVKEQIKRQNLSQSHQKIYLRFCFYARQLLLFHSTEEWAQLQKRLKEERSVNNSFWLQEKFAEL